MNDLVPENGISALRRPRPELWRVFELLKGKGESVLLVMTLGTAGKVRLMSNERTERDREKEGGY